VFKECVIFVVEKTAEEPAIKKNITIMLVTFLSTTKMVPTRRKIAEDQAFSKHKSSRVNIKIK
jgi:hypothetical protein